jgi:formylglycine-generating enzyme required for sulfatase activity
MAVAFCERLTVWARQQGQVPAGHAFTLPTEAQWEYACSTGLAGPASGNDNSMTLADRAWTRANAWYRPHPAGMKAPDAHGLHDLLGNVWEWCIDWKDRYPGRAQTDPQGPDSGIFRVARGGGFLLDERYCRAANRGGAPQTTMWKNIGFRVALVRVP